MKRIGIVACAAEGASLCYRTICNEASSPVREYDHPESVDAYRLLESKVKCDRRAR